MLALRLFLLVGAAWTATVDIQIQSGPVSATVRGNILAEGWGFYGIPYANSVVGDNRFEVSLLWVY